MMELFLTNSLHLFFITMICWKTNTMRRKFNTPFKAAPDVAAVALLVTFIKNLLN